MTEPARRDRAATRWRRLVLIATVIALLAGCELATGQVRTETELRQAGIRNLNLQYDEGVATLEYEADSNPLEARAEQDRAAEVIWRNLPFQIDRITVISQGGGLESRRDYPRALLEQRLGPRPAGLDRTAADIARRAVLIAVVVAVVVLVLVVLIIVLVVRAVRRRPSPQPAGAWSQPGPQQPWGQPPQAQQPWGQPTQPAQQSWGQAGPPEQPGQPPNQGWPPPQPPPAPPPQSTWPAGPAGGADWPTGAPRPEAGEPPRAPEGPPPAPEPPPPAPEPPARGPGDTQRLEPDPPPEAGRGPTPPA